MIVLLLGPLPCEHPRGEIKTIKIKPNEFQLFYNVHCAHLMTSHRGR